MEHIDQAVRLAYVVRCSSGLDSVQAKAKGIRTLCKWFYLYNVYRAECLSERSHSGEGLFKVTPDLRTFDIFCDYITALLSERADGPACTKRRALVRDVSCDFCTNDDRERGHQSHALSKEDGLGVGGVLEVAKKGCSVVERGGQTIVGGRSALCDLNTTKKL